MSPVNEVEPESQRLHGKISSWKDDRGFGFITPSVGGDDVFVHISAFADRGRRPQGSEAVTYQIRTDAQGRTQAFRVWFAGEGSRQPRTSTTPVVHALIFSGLSLALVAILASVGKLPAFVFALYLGASIVAFITYAWDKSAARRDRWRTAESTLHLLGIAGGWPGALVARHMLRHKSKKRSFILVFWVTVAFNISALIWFLTPAGQRVLQAIAGAT